MSREVQWPDQVLGIAIFPGGSKSHKNNSSKMSSPVSAAPRRYAVLYYKRKKKVHKQKGVSKEDGILVVEPPPSCKVSLFEDDGSSMSQGNNSKKAKAATLVTSGINWTISKKAFGVVDAKSGAGNVFQLGPNGLADGDIVEMSSAALDCEITAVLDGGGGGAATNNTTSVGAAGGKLDGLKKSVGGLGGGGLKKRPGGLGAGMNRGGMGLGGAGVGRGLVGRKPTTGNPLVGRKRPLGGLGAGAGSSGIGLGRGLAGRRPPPQPKREADNATCMNNDESDDEDEEMGAENMTEAKANATVGRGLLSRVPSSLLGGGGKKRRIVSGRGLGATASTTNNAASSSGAAAAAAADSFPGAIGTITAPASIRGILRPHQREGVTFLWNCLTGASPDLQRVAEESGAGPTASRGAILADEMGLGKTLMTITTMFALHRRNRDHRFVVVCPSSLVSNWSKEFDKWISKASQPKRVVIRRGGEEGLRAIKAFVPVKPNMSEILIVSYELFRMNISELKKAEQIGLLVVDEGHRLKNTAGSQTLSALNALRCEARLLITGTPIQNNLSEFHNVVNFVCPGILSDLSTFRRTYERPINASNIKAASSEQRAKGRSLSKALESITSVFMLRRLQRDVLKEHLPPRSEILLFCRPSERQTAEYISLTKGVRGDAGPGGAAVSADALTLLTKVRKLCSHPYLLNEDGEDPFARKRSANAESDGNCEHVALSGKLSVLESLLSSIRSEAPGDKVVVISNFTSALSVIEQAVLQRRGWSSLRLDGTTEQNARQSLVDSFNRGSVDQSYVFLLSSKAGGCGLNLIGANRLVMFDW